MQVDPAASLQLWELDVELGGRTFTVPALPASEWFPVLLAGDPHLLLDMVLSSEEVDEVLLSGAVTGEGLAEALMDTIEAVAGREFQAAFTLAQVAKIHWPLVAGQLAQRSFEWDRRPLGAALDAIYSIVTQYMKPEDRAKFDALLDTPIPGTKRIPDRTAALSDFEAMAGPKPTAGVIAPASVGPSGSAPPRIRPRSRPRPAHAPSP